MSWLERAMRRGRGLFWALAALAIGPPFAIALVLVAGLVTDTEVRVDVALIAFALVLGLALAVGAYALHQRLRPRLRVSITYDMRLEQPLTPLGRYAFRLSIYYEAEQQGERRLSRQDGIELRFRGRDHPDLLTWCTTTVGQHLERHRQRAGQLYPGAEILVSPVPELVRAPERVADVEWVDP
jgi:hypothetical protein